MNQTGVLEEIYNFRWRTPDLATGGQPLEVELRAVAAAQVEAVINLALLDGRILLSG